MTKDDIIRMARETGFCGMAIDGDYDFDVVGNIKDLEQFAALVAAAEREACAKLADKYMERWTADAIRARGQ